MTKSVHTRRGHCRYCKHYIKTGLRLRRKQQVEVGDCKRMGKEVSATACPGTMYCGVGHEERGTPIVEAIEDWNKTGDDDYE